MSDRNTSPSFAIGGDTQRRLSGPFPNDEDFKRLFGDGWEEAKANHERIAALPFPEGFDFTEILEP